MCPLASSDQHDPNTDRVCFLRVLHAGLSAEQEPARVGRKGGAGGTGRRVDARALSTMDTAQLRVSAADLAVGLALLGVGRRRATWCRSIWALVRCRNCSINLYIMVQMVF